MIPPPPRSTLFPYTTLFRSDIMTGLTTGMIEGLPTPALAAQLFQWYRQTPYMLDIGLAPVVGASIDRKSTRLNSSHTVISYAVFCLKKKKNKADIVQVTSCG